MMAHNGESGQFRLSRALNDILADLARRSVRLVSGPFTRLFALQHILHSIPGAWAGYIDLATAGNGYGYFVPGPVPDPSPSAEDLVSADVHNFISTSMNYGQWVDRATQIRSSGIREYCVGNLSVALAVGPAYAFGMAGSNTLLSLIPTAGVLIGAPAKELWVLYKLCPVAGILSILLSLGGSIVPMEVNDYENIDAFHYQGLVPVADDRANDDEGKIENKTEAERFADAVAKRANQETGTRPMLKIGAAMGLQCAAIGAILIACWFLEAGAVLVWWCEAGYWMFIWYIVVAFSSVLENFAGVPFTKTWTIRVWRAPQVDIDERAPWVIPPTPENRASLLDLRLSEPDDDDPIAASIHEPLMSSYPGIRIARKPVTRSTVRSPDTGSNSYNSSPHSLPQVGTREQDFSTSAADVLTRLEKGYSTKGNISMDLSRPWTQSDDAFYVLLSVKGIDRGHAVLRVASKIASIGVFAIGTSLFASAALITILEALVAAALILCAGIFGRVTAMWMASTMMANRPVLHRVVKNRKEAERYLVAIFRKPNIACEVKQHIILQGRCVKKFNRYCWSNIFGVLASPYDLTKLAVNGAQAQKMQNQRRYGEFEQEA